MKGGFFVSALAIVADAEILSVNFGRSNQDSPIQDGFDAFLFDDNESHTVSYGSAWSTDNTIDVTISDEKSWRTYFPIGGGSYNQSDLLSSSVIRSDNGRMILTLGDLKEGIYQITTYHHSTRYGSPIGRFGLYLTNADRTDFQMFTNQTVFHATSPEAITALAFEFVSAGSNEVVISMDKVEGQQFKLNGFEIIPELPTMSLLALSERWRSDGAALFRRSWWCHDGLPPERPDRSRPFSCL